MVSLLAYDGRPNSEKVLVYAINHAVDHKIPLYIMSSVTAKDKSDYDRELLKVKEYLEAARVRAVEAGAEAHTLVSTGNPAHEIISSAERVEADTIIVGHGGKSAFDRVVIGSVSEQVLRTSRCTVIVVH